MSGTHRVDIDPRGPRFGAAITAFLLLIAIVVGLSGSVAVAFWIVAALATLFAWGAFAGVQRHPWGLLFRAVIRPRLNPPAELENAAAPTFAQLVGFVITAAGLVLQLAGVDFALVTAASLAFVAAFLNAVFDYCLGCQMYLALTRIRAGRRGGVASS